jgi:hypothetical protein
VHAVSNDDLTVGVVRARDPDPQADGPAVVPLLPLDAQRFAAPLGDLTDVDVQFCRAALRRVVLERQVTLESVPAARKSNSEVFDDVERAVGMNRKQRIEVADANRAPLRARGSREREKEKECLADR